ncbi:MAG TPA: hypothetical protein VFY51_09520 [Pyrinomonadaceae bacterium]|nr:hypothetical protein [Pyrinomonadaceae bacterium]
MRPEPNNDIDLLLRQLSRRNGVPASEIDEPHLDADELNSYVANALPAAARARYTAHLADCSTCRKMVVELSAAQGPVAVQQTPPAIAPSGLMSFLASLFSPMVLRYAVPALGLIVVAAIGFVALRQSGRNAPVAMNEGTQSKAVVEGSPQSPLTYTSSAPDARSEISQQQSESTIAKKEEQVAKAVAPAAKEAAPVIANQPAEAAGATAAEPPPAPKAVAEEDRSRIAELQKEKKTEVAQPAGVSDSAKARAADAEKDDSSKNKASTVTVAPGTVARKDIDVRPAKSPEPFRAGRGQEMKRAPAPATGSLQSARGAEAESAAETRSVAGRRFRKSGRVWIDTGFDSSKPITAVARNSEQYRALIADEPSIRTIADELDGEVIVVWKSRTYRIR